MAIGGARRQALVMVGGNWYWWLWVAMCGEQWPAWFAAVAGSDCNGLRQA